MSARCSTLTNYKYDEISLYFSIAGVVIDHAAGNIFLPGGANFTSAVGDIITLRNFNGAWREVSRAG